MGQPAVKYYTQEEYLAFERESPEKHEYYKGEIFNMSGASYEHNVIEDNLRGSLHSFLKGKPCRSLGSNLRVHASKNTLYTYPDVLIVCGEPKFLDDTFDTLLNPSVLFEILSPSSTNYDKGVKFELYRDIESLQEYVTISSMKMHAELYQRNNDGSWVLTEYKLPQDSFTLRTIEMKILLSDLYDGVKFG
ncbi:MAG: Uma2 family endonuclease [Chitinophagaceae bacterium]|nr:Uma2 family endonuclease [Chitinophagaceae bacterium]